MHLDAVSSQWKVDDAPKMAWRSDGSVVPHLSQHSELLYSLGDETDQLTMNDKSNQIINYLIVVMCCLKLLFNDYNHHGVPILLPCELLPLHSAIQLQNMPVLCGKDHPMQRKLTPPLMTAADASLGACDLRMLTVYMSWLLSPHLAFADR